MKQLYVIIEINDGKIDSTSMEALGKAIELKKTSDVDVVAVVIGYKVESIIDSLQEYEIDKIVCVVSEEYVRYSTDAYSYALEKIIEYHKPNILFIPGTKNGKDLAGRITARLRLGLVADCSDVYFKEEKLIWERPTFDGKMYCGISIDSKVQIGTIASGVFLKPKKCEKRKINIVFEDINYNIDKIRTKILETIIDQDKINKINSLENAEIVVGIGQGIKEKENLPIVEEFCEALGATLGVSKPLVDKGWFDKEKQIGVTGKKINAKLYICIGISGAIQHIGGIKNCGYVVAINNDKEAPIFKNAQIGIVADLFEILPKLTEKIKEICKK